MLDVSAAKLRAAFEDVGNIGVKEEKVHDDTSPDTGKRMIVRPGGTDGLIFRGSFGAESMAVIPDRLP